jgi:hypothetical protein
MCVKSNPNLLSARLRRTARAFPTSGHQMKDHAIGKQNKGSNYCTWRQIVLMNSACNSDVSIGNITMLCGGGKVRREDTIMEDEERALRLGQHLKLAVMEHTNHASNDGRKVPRK